MVQIAYASFDYLLFDKEQVIIDINFKDRTFTWVDTEQIRSLFNNKDLFEILVFGGFFYNKHHPQYHSSHDLKDIGEMTKEGYFNSTPEK